MGRDQQSSLNMTTTDSAIVTKTIIKKSKELLCQTSFYMLCIQLNKYETDPDFPQIFQSNTSVCLIISVFCKSCEPICEPEITPVLYHLENQNKNNFTLSVQFTNLAKRRNIHCRFLEILKKIWICLAFI